ncbi:MAG: hypothetical protein ACQETE_10195 [Bacteroidota bacterium]
MLRAIRNSMVQKIASRHIAGASLPKALSVCKWTQSRSMACIISPWADRNGPSHNGSSVKWMVNQYKLALDALNSHDLDGYLSIKLDAINYDFGVFRDLLEYAQPLGIRVHIDSLGADTADITFRFLKRASEYHQILGCTLPSRWKRSLSDAERAIDLQVAVRLVKGQWPDPHHTVDERKQFLALTDKLAGWSRHLGIATHDLPLAQKALAIASESPTSTDMEQFFSLPMNAIETARDLNCDYRLYVSYGQPAIPYNYRFSMTRPSLASWMVTDLLFNLKRPWK